MSGFRLGPSRIRWYPVSKPLSSLVQQIQCGSVAHAVPEPSTLALVGLGIGGALWMARRRQRLLTT